MGKIAKLIYNLPSLLTRKNLERIVKLVRLFGFIVTYKEISKNLWFAIDGAINIIPIEAMREESILDEHATVSVVIPVKNPGDDFCQLLTLMKNQKGFKDIEIIVVDSGSTDRSLEFSEGFGAKIIQILPEEFSHSYARNLAAEHASGDYLLFTVQDALPPSDLWLYELFSVTKDNDIDAVSCTEFLRKDVDLFYRIISWHHNRFMEVDKQDRIMCKPDVENHLTLRKNGQLSNVACFISKDVFMKYRFRGNYAEDLDLGVRLIGDGYKLALLSSTRIIHSHNRPAYHHLKRGYVDKLFISQILPERLILAMDAERLFQDIVFIYEVVNSIVCKELQRVTVPCTIRRLSSIVMEKFRTAVKGWGCYPLIIDIESNGYIDNKFKCFLESIYNRYYLNGKNNLTYEGILLDEMQSFTIIILEYMEDNYKLLDDTVLEEFKSCLWKAHAFQCGRHLASCFLQSSESTKEKIKEINDELTKGI